MYHLYVFSIGEHLMLFYVSSIYVFSVSSICVLYSFLYKVLYRRAPAHSVSSIYVPARFCGALSLSLSLSLSLARALSLSDSPLNLALLRAVARLLQLLFQRRPLPRILRVRHVRDGRGVRERGSGSDSS
jgi:hypothetical protein